MLVVITGGSSGLGHELVNQLMAREHKIVNWSHETGVDVRIKGSVAQAAAKLGPNRVDVLINCAGVNGIDFLADVTEEDWDRIMDTNCKGIFLCTQALLERLRDGTVVNIVSNAAHVPMTSSLAYNSSKAGALMATKQLARELKKTHNITVFSVSPNKLAGTQMSRVIEERVCKLRGWTPEQARKYQLDALPAGHETPPGIVAEFICFLLSSKERHRYLAGVDIPYGGP